MDWERLSINADGLDCNRLLADWRWLVPPGPKPFSLTLFGDCFMEDEAGRVLFLDTVGGQLSEIADSRAAFVAAREDPANSDQWYMPDLALLSLDHGLQPGPQQCLSFTLPPVLNGELVLENVEVCDLMVHQSITAQIHRSVRHLPEGTRISRFVVDGEQP